MMQKDLPARYGYIYRLGLKIKMIVNGTPGQSQCFASSSILLGRLDLKVFVKDICLGMFCNSQMYGTLGTMK